MDRNILINELNNGFYSFWMNKSIDIESDYKSIPTNRYNACMMYLYETCISKLEIESNRKIKKYNHIDYITIIEWYIAKSLDYNFISIYGLALLLNRSINWLYSVKNCDTNDICNMFIIESNNNNVLLDNISNNDVINGANKSSGVDENATVPIIDITKKLFESIQQSTVNKLNDTPMGLVVNANNNKEIGLMYAKERIQEQTKARLTISLNDLPKLE